MKLANDHRDAVLSVPKEIKGQFGNKQSHPTVGDDSRLFFKLRDSNPQMAIAST